MGILRDKDEYIEHYNTEIISGGSGIDEDKLKESRELAKNLFEGKKDESGRPYFEHPEAVAEMVTGTLQKTIAYLHDVLEDVPEKYSEEMMRSQFGDFVTDSVKLLTHGSNLTREEYLECIRHIAESGNTVAIDVKIADLTHNSDISRLGAKTPEDLTEKQRLRYEKYIEALEILKAVKIREEDRAYDRYIDYMMGGPEDY